MSAYSIAAPRTERAIAHSNIEYVLDQTAFLALFVSVVGLVLVKGPDALLTIAGLLGSYLQSAAPLFQ